MTSIKNTDCPLLQKGEKRTTKTNFRDYTVCYQKNGSLQETQIKIVCRNVKEYLNYKNYLTNLLGP
jgi:hypothetical protein